MVSESKSEVEKTRAFRSGPSTYAGDYYGTDLRPASPRPVGSSTQQLHEPIGTRDGTIAASHVSTRLWTCCSCTPFVVAAKQTFTKVAISRIPPHCAKVGAMTTASNGMRRSPVAHPNVTISAQYGPSKHLSPCALITPQRACQSPGDGCRGSPGSMTPQSFGDEHEQCIPCPQRHNSSITALRMKAKEHSVVVDMARTHNGRAV